MHAPSTFATQYMEASQTFTLLAEGAWEAVSVTEIAGALESGFAQGAKHIVFQAATVTEHDATFFAALQVVQAQCAQKGVKLSVHAPPSAENLVKLSAGTGAKASTKENAHPPEAEHNHEPRATTLACMRHDIEEAVETIAHIANQPISKFAMVMQFIGNFVLAALQKPLYKVRDIAWLIEQTGPRALFIVALISFLVGLILAFIGAIQLEAFGADLYIADLVGLAMVREMGAVMAAVILAGRTGAAYAAELASMRVNEELDALETMGLSVMRLLVVPRVWALALMLPILTLFADVIGILGGLVVGVGLFDISFMQYIGQTQLAISWADVWVGVIKGGVFGILVAGCGCYHGMHSGRDAAAVGGAATSAVVAGIISIVVADAIFAVTLNVLGI